MPLKYIPKDVYTEMLQHSPEWSMGYHFVQSDDGQTISIAISGTILIDLDDELETSIKRLSSMSWTAGQKVSHPATQDLSYEEHCFLFDQWCNQLGEATYGDLRPTTHENVARLALDPYDPRKTPRGPAPALNTLGRPVVHGHLPFRGRTKGATVFYRAEPIPKSHYIDPVSGHVQANGGLYAFPASEVPFVPTGFSAVGRYALPNVAPSIFRWELRAPAGVRFSAGASVPLYGQAGGGVEICIEQAFRNVGNISNPVILPAL